VIVLLTLWRACIPAGYMPAADALAHGRWALTLCPVTGPVPSAPDHSNHHGHHSHGTSPHRADVHAQTHAGTHHEPGSVASGLDCPYSLIAHLSLTDTPALPGMLPAAGRAAHPVPVSEPVSSRRPTAGSPLGPRAPPVV